MSVQALVVEDSQTQALRLRLLLERAGLAVEIAPTGQAAIAAATRMVPNVVILDINLPDIDGFTVCRHLKHQPATADIPVIMLTVKDEASDTLAGLDAGADAYIPKDDFAEVNLLEALRELNLLS